MKRRRLVAIAAAALGAVASGLLAVDMRDRGRALERGDAAYADRPGAATWAADPLLPGDPAGHILRVHDDVQVRIALRAFVRAERMPPGFDNGERRAAARAIATAALGRVALSSRAVRAARAYDLIGILAATGDDPDEEQARVAFATAVRTDGANENAKYNLELLLRRTNPIGARRGASSGAGPRGGRGAGAAGAGRGY